MLRPRSFLRKHTPFHFYLPSPSYSTSSAAVPKPNSSTPTSAFQQEEQPKQDAVLKHRLRTLLRDTAQPVAVITSLMPSGPDVHSHFVNAKDSKCKYHGATLSSFNSISMDPYPLVSFALRIPSRMALSLSSSSPSVSSFSSSSPSTSSTSKIVERSKKKKPTMVINLLSHLQPHEATLFSRPDLHPEPFTNLSYRLTNDGLPVLDNSLGALTCELIGGPIPLHDLAYLEGERVEPEERVIEGGGGVSSELFIARVVRVEDVQVQDGELGEEGERTLLPLLYHRRGFTACRTEHLPTRTNA